RPLARDGCTSGAARARDSKNATGKRRDRLALEELPPRDVGHHCASASRDQLLSTERVRCYRKKNRLLRNAVVRIRQGPLMSALSTSQLLQTTSDRDWRRRPARHRFPLPT